jgi:hypothetical protein
MPATTVKLDSELLREIAKIKSPRQTLAAFVRESLQRDIERRKLRTAAEAYRQLLAENEEERRDLEQWEASHLAAAPARARR